MATSSCRPAYESGEKLQGASWNLKQVAAHKCPQPSNPGWTPFIRQTGWEQIQAAEAPISRVCLDTALVMTITSLILFVVWAFAMAHYYALGTTDHLLAALAVALVVMRILSGKRPRSGS
jgi:hypothetical protein